MLASWLLTAVARTVTTYTKPSQRVLLLQPASYLTTSGRTWTQQHCYDGLHEAGWTVFRLGRGVQTRTAVTSAADLRECGPAESESGLDRYELVLAAVDPDAVTRFHPSGWADLLTPTGTLAVITRGARSGGRFVDPAAQIVRAVAHDAGLLYLDRIALLREPLGDVLPGRSASVLHREVHDDLLVFGRPAASARITEPVGDSR
ncbi:hypothetical protein [Lentzea sp. CA-135723]|uniref:hypothetical protein n=1 Tax=Lentzea sp. CA-135723 TaxID=3239950 RepID=UPI003D93909B